MREEEKMKPEDYWSGAEQLLDNHFQAKKRRRLLLLFLLLLGGSAGIGSYVYYGSYTSKTAETPSKTMSPSNEVALENIIGSAKENTTVSVPEENEITYPPSSGEPSIKNKSTPIVAVNRNAIFESKLMPAEHSPGYAQIETENAESIKGIENNIILGSTSLTEQISFVSMNGYPPFSSFNVDDIKMNQQPEKLKSKSKWDLFLYGGAGVVSKDLRGSPVNYINRRNSEEENIILPEAGFQFGKSIGDFDIRGGVAFAVVGEQVNYSPYSRGEYYGASQQWQQYQYSVTDTDSTYIFGMLFLNTQIIQRTDSVLKDVVDTLSGLHYNEGIALHNGSNRKYIIEVPLTVTYQLSRNRFGIGVFAGVAPGIIIKSKGYYLMNDESAIADLSESKRQYTFNVQGGLEFSFLANEHLRLVLRPVTKMYLTGVTEKNGASSKYRSNGLQLGIVKSFH